MRHKAVLLSLALAIVCVPAALSQTDLNSRIQSLENAAASGTATHKQQLDLARLYVQSGRYYEATKITNRLLDANPSDADAIALRDEAKRGMKDVADRRVAEAELAARGAAATDADRLALADAYFDAGSYRSAAEAYRRLPANVVTRDVRLRQARALAWSGQLDAAERAYANVLRDQRTTELDLEYGRLLSWMGASRAATRTLTEVHRTAPSEDSATALANALAWSGDHDGAIALLNTYNASHPEAVQTRTLLTELEASPNLRIERVDRMIQAEPHNLALRIERARLLSDSGRYSEALRDIRFIREHSAQSIEGLDAIEKRARDARAREMESVAARLRTIDANSASDPAELLSLAKAYTGLEDYDTAIRLYERYLQQRPDDVEARVQYARVLSWDKRWAAAERQYEQLIASNPDRADLRLEYAQVLSYDADFRGAMSMFSSLTDLSDNPRAHLYPDVPQKAHYNLGQIYRWYGWNEHAINEQNRALALDGSYLPAREELDLARNLRPNSSADLRYSYATDSNDFTMRRYDLTGEKWTSQRTGLNASIGRHLFSHQNDEIGAVAASGGLSYRWNDKTLARANIGANFYDDGFGTRPFWGAGVQWMPNIQSRAALDYNRYDLVYDVFTLTSLRPTVVPTTLRDPLTINDFRGHYDYSSGGVLSWLADASYGFVSDDNRRAGAHGLVSFQLMKSPFIAIKADGRYLSYDFRTNRYWSPDNYRSLAGVLHVGHHFGNRLFWSVEGKLGNSWDDDRRSDLQSYHAKLTYAVNDLIDIVGAYNYGKSGRLEVPFGGSNSPEAVNYWQRYWYAGIRLKQLFSRDDRRGNNPYYYDSRSLTGSPVVGPLGETR